MNEVPAFMFWYFTGVVFMLGACWGSFLNVCIHRIPIEKSVVAPRSHCPTCGRLIAWYDNIPLFSYLRLGAKCRHCSVHISARYVLVELLTAILFTWVWLEYGFVWKTLVYWVLVAALIVGTFIDFEHMIIPDRVTLGGIALGLVLSPLLPELHGEVTARGGFLACVIGAAFGYGLLKLVAVLGKLAFKKDAMGMGDVKLMGGLGALLGYQAVIFIIMVSALAGSVVGIVMILGKHKEWQSRIPYGPYISLAAMVWILGGYRLWGLYWNYVTAVPL